MDVRVYSLGSFIGHFPFFDIFFKSVNKKIVEKRPIDNSKKSPAGGIFFTS